MLPLESKRLPLKGDSFSLHLRQGYALILQLCGRLFGSWLLVFGVNVGISLRDSSHVATQQVEEEHQRGGPLEESMILEKHVMISCCSQVRAIGYAFISPPKQQQHRFEVYTGNHKSSIISNNCRNCNRNCHRRENTPLTGPTSLSEGRPPCYGAEPPQRTQGRAVL